MKTPRWHIIKRYPSIPRLLVPLMLAILPMNVHAIATCTASATGVAFGGYNFRDATPTSSIGSVSVSCTLLGLLSLLGGYEIKLDAGNAGNYLPRKMSNGLNIHQYSLYNNAARSIIWGDGSGSTATIIDGYLLGVGTTVLSYPVYGRIPASQNIPQGMYSDTITVTVNY